MPIHDWSRVGAGVFHHFLQAPLERTYCDAFQSLAEKYRQVLERV